MANGLLDPVYRIKPNLIDGIRRSGDGAGRLGTMQITPGFMSIAGRTITLRKVRQVGAGHLVTTGRVLRIDKRKPITVGHLAVSGKVVSFAPSVHWASIPDFIVPRGTVPYYITAVRATYLFDPGGLVVPSAVAMENEVAGEVVYQAGNDRIAVLSDPGVDKIYSVRMYADYGVVAGTTVTNLTLTSPITGSLPFTFGQAFKQGDIPAGQFISSDAPSFQAQIRNVWADGSAKFAVISGRATLAGAPLAVAIQRNATAPTGTNIAEPSPATLGSSISVTLTGAGAGSYTPQTAATNGITAWNRTTARKVREFLGPVMSEFHYYTPTADGHLTIWWYVRVYSDRTSVETVIENGWAKIAGSTEKAYTANVVIGGTSRFNSAVAHRHHARWSRTDWIGTDPQITPKHDAAYLKSTKLVPNYAVFTPASTTGGVSNTNTGLANYAQSAAPMTIGNFEQNGEGGGFHPWLGILPEWEAAYVVSGDVRAYRAMLANEQALNCCGIDYEAGGGPGPAGFSTRDETTGYPAMPNDFTADTYQGGTSLVQGSDSTTRPWWTDRSHAVNGGYLSYLTTGRWFALETSQMLTFAEFAVTSPGGGLLRLRRGTVQDRGAAWHMRTMAAALSITPDNSVVRTKLTTYVEQNVVDWRTNEVSLNNLGFRQNPYNTTDYGSAWSAPGFQAAFIVQAFAFANDVCGHILATPANLSQSAAFHAILPVGLLGVRPGGFCYRRAANYGIPSIGPSQGVFYSSFGALYDGCTAVDPGTFPVDTTCAVGQSLTTGNVPDMTSYWGNFMPAICAAVDLGVSGAGGAYARMTGATASPGWNQLLADFPYAPQFATVPRP